MEKIDDIAVEIVGSGRPALFIHGVPATHTLWAPVVERLAGERLCIVPDLPGFGGSGVPDPLPSIAETARRMIALLDALDIAQVDLVGHSYGGAVALALAAQAPERVRTLAALTPLTPTPPPLARIARRRTTMGIISLLWRIAPGFLRRFFIAGIWTRINYGVAWEPRRAREVAREADRSDMVDVVRGRMSGADFGEYDRLLDDLERIDLPLLLLSAGHDRVVPCQRQLALCARFPAAHHQHFSDGGHLLMWQYPDRVAEMIGELWRVESGDSRRLT